MSSTAPVPASLGWQWVKQGFNLFRRQPLMLMFLFTSYFSILLGLQFIPLFGNWLSLFLVPILTFGYMQGCAMVDQNKPMTPAVLISGFRLPNLKELFQLGLIYLLAVLFLYWSFDWIADPEFAKAFSNPTALSSSEAIIALLTPRTLFALAFFSLGLLLISMAFWYAPVLVGWQKMEIVQSLFYSFHMVLRASKAFLMYSLAWFGIMLGCAIAVNLMSLILQIDQAWILLILFTLFTVVMSMVYCSFYPTFTTLFGKPGEFEISSA